MELSYLDGILALAGVVIGFVLSNINESVKENLKRKITKLTKLKCPNTPASLIFRQTKKESDENLQNLFDVTLPIATLQNPFSQVIKAYLVNSNWVRYE
jgi:hypothetical protein